MERTRNSCPISGLPILSRPDWAYHNSDTGCHLQVAFVGDRIVWSRVAGYIHTEDAEPCADLLSRVIDEQIPAPQQYVHLADCRHLRGASYQARRRYDRLLGERGRLEALVLYGLSPLNSLLLRVGVRVSAPYLEVAVADDYAGALAIAARRLGLALPNAARAPARSLSVPHRISHPDWALRTERLSASFEVIDGDTLLSAASGTAREEDIERLNEIRRAVLQACSLDRFRFVVASMDQLTGVTPRARRRYVDSLREWHAEHPVDAFIFYDCSPALRAGIALGRPFVPFRILVGRDRKHALELLEEERSRSRRSHLGRSWLDRLALRRHRRAAIPVDALLEYLGSIDWAEGGRPEVDIPENLPRANEVFGAIDLIKQDLDETLRELEAAREEARRGQQQLRGALERLPEGIVLLDEDGRVALVNPAAEELLPLVAQPDPGESLERIAGRPLSAFLSTSDDDAWQEIVLDGPPRRVLEIAGRELASGGRVLVLRDLTRERTVQQQLEQRERLAAVGQLAAGIAHDFNNLLQGILLSAYKLADHDDPAVRTSGEVVARQSERGARLIRQILDFGRRSVSRRGPIDLSELLEDLVGLLSRTIPETIEIGIECDAGPHWISGDKAQLEQLVTNLALNARDAMPDGGSLYLKIAERHFGPSDPMPEADMAPGDWVALSVIDTGSGIAPDDLPRIFEPFFSTKGPTEGTGLGLAQVYGIVKQHEAFISCDSRPGRGTTFDIFFPRIEPREKRARPIREAEAPGDGGHVILVVEDDEMIRQLIAETLSSRGHRVLTAASGDDALDLLERSGERPSLVISDVVMPDMGGAELCRELRSRWPEIRVLLMSGYPLGEDPEELGTEGVGGWLEKPFSMQTLSTAAQRLLEQTATESHEA